MPVELKGNQLRIRVLPSEGSTKIRIQDVGTKGKLQRVAAFYPGRGWKTQGWRLNLKDYKDEKEMLKDLVRVAWAERWSPSSRNLIESRMLIRKKLREMM
jgi:hypothetical protein